MSAMELLKYGCAIGISLFVIGTGVSITGLGIVLIIQYWKEVKNDYN